MSNEKEPHYFSKHYKTKSEEWHDYLFNNDDEEFLRYGESSTSYSVDELALDRISKDINDIKIIVAMRDPVERLISHYKWMWVQGLEVRPIIQAVNEEMERGYDVQKDTKGNYYTYFHASNYSRFVPYMLEKFGVDNILLIRSEELRINTQEILNVCFQFLGLEEEECQFMELSNTTEQVSKKQGSQRHFGLKAVSMIIPKKFKDKIDSKHYIRNRLKLILGRRVISPPIVSEEEKEVLTELLQSEIDFYQKRFI